MKFKLAAAAIFASAAFLAAPSVQAEWKPSGPITLTIGFGPGGSTDTMGRLIAANIEKTRGWTVVVKNKGGGGGVVMLKGLMQKKPDGQNIGMAVSTGVVLAVATRKPAPFQLNSFDYLATVATGHLVIVTQGSRPYNDIAGLIAFAKKNGGAAVASNGLTGNMLLKVLSKSSGANLRAVPTKGGGEVMKQLLGGHVAAGFDGGRHMRYMKDGTIKVLATLSRSRHPLAMNQKTLREQGFNYPVEPTWFAAAPKGLPADVKATLAKAFDDAINSDEVKKIVAKRLRMQVRNLGPEGTGKLINEGLGSLNNLIAASK